MCVYVGGKEAFQRGKQLFYERRMQPANWNYLDVGQHIDWDMYVYAMYMYSSKYVAYTMQLFSQIQRFMAHTRHITRRNNNNCV
jgi:hypothetical protein